MTFMSRRSFFRICLMAATFGLILSTLPAAAQRDDSSRGRKYKAPPPTAHIVVTVVRSDNGKPIENAAVIFRALHGDKNQGNMELKSDYDGKAVIDLLPIGDTLQLQIIAKGYATFGMDYKIDKVMAVEVRMKLPQGQYSIYKKH